MMVARPKTFNWYFRNVIEGNNVYSFFNFPKWSLKMEQGFQKPINRVAKMAATYRFSAQPVTSGVTSLTTWTRLFFFLGGGGGGWGWERSLLNGV